MLAIEQRKKLIISADDFGISTLANASILELIRQGKIDRVEVMISENLTPEEIEEIKNSGVKTDIHLHLINYNSDYWQGNRRLKESSIKRLIAFVFNYGSGRRSADKVALQWAIQIEKFKDLFGRNPDGIGSHEYIHFFPPYFKAVMKLAKKYEIPYIRLGDKSLVNDNDGMNAKILNWLRGRNVNHLNGGALATSDYMASLDWVEEDLPGFINGLPAQTQTELVCHPEREEELEMLRSI